MFKNIFIFCFISIFSLSCHSANHRTQTEVNFVKELASANHLVLGVHSDLVLGPIGAKLDKTSNGSISQAIKSFEFKGEELTSQLIPVPESSGFKQILLVGLGARKEAKTDLKWQEIGGQATQDAIKSFKKVPLLAFDLSLEENSVEINSHLAYGSKLGSYYFDKYYTNPEKIKSQKQLKLLVNDPESIHSHYQQHLDPIANAVWLTRDISNEPANKIYPQSFVDSWSENFKGMKNIKIKVLDEKDMIKMNMGAIYGVGRGSKNPPRMMIVEYMAGSKDDKPIVIVGKGITFDTGGISLKNPTNMWNMKFDMSGAASSMGTVYALAGQNAKVNIVAIAALAENMPGANAQRPGDVVTSMSRKTIQIRSTDAEGRLVLADGIYYGDSTYNPQLLIDLATLTGSASRALGKDYAAMFTRHEELTEAFETAGKESGDQVWHLPLNDKHFKAIENTVADVMNSGPDAPGASAGAAFLGTFVRETTPWVHFDIAGVAYGDHTTPLKSSPGSFSFGVRLLTHYINTQYSK